MNAPKILLSLVFGITLVFAGSIRSDFAMMAMANTALQPAAALQNDQTWHTIKPIQQQGSFDLFPENSSSAESGTPGSASQPINCEYEKPAKPEYGAKLFTTTSPASAAPGEKVQVKVVLLNTGNTPWFSAKSGCQNVPTVSLGTALERDHSSLFYPGNNPLLGWASSNRIPMNTLRVDPKQPAVFTFQARAPQNPGYYREIFAPVVEGLTWMEKNALFHLDLKVGEITLTEKQQKYFPYLQQTGNLANLNLEGEKKIEVSLKQQKMFLRIGDLVIRNFPISSGARRTPTPRGTYKISLKQDVRIGAKKPHYIMPKFQLFRAGGYGIHALPSLANDRGVFWREALNHIGTPRSHGCIRLLPDDADFTYEFTDIGTKMEIKA